MDIAENIRAEILLQALPYIKDWAGKTVVVKYGGAAMTNENVRQAVAQDIVLMSTVGIRTVLVHGGGPEIDAMLRRLGKEPLFVKGLRYTDEETMEVVRMVLSGKVNKDIVALIHREGGRALGLSGVDGAMIRAKRHSKEDLGFVGDIVSVDPAALLGTLAAGFVPVVSTVGVGVKDDDNYYNINADTAAAEIAVALKAEKLMLLTDVPGILRDLSDISTLIDELSRAEIPALVRDGVVAKGMIPKVECCARAVEGGVARAHIIDGRAPHSLILELFTDSGSGTMIY
ncbi:MAG: acetylglutamate kinase [Treponema sp.]|nr:acetylglutamate kinase [Treponema sp.]